MIKNKNKKSPLIVKTAVFNAIMCCMMSQYALAAPDAIISTPGNYVVTSNTLVTSNKPNSTTPDHYNVNVTPHTPVKLTIKDKAEIANEAGKKVIEAGSAANIIIEGGASVKGVINTAGNATLEVGEKAGTAANLHGKVILQGDSVATFDNVLLHTPTTKDEHMEDYGVEVLDKSKATFGTNTFVKSLEASGVLVGKNATVIANGSKLEGYYSGVMTEDHAILLTKKANIEGDLNGVLVFGHSDVNIQGGVVEVAQGGAGSNLLNGRYGNYGAGVNVIGRSKDGLASTVSITDKAEIIANKPGGVGIYTQMFGKSSTTINVKDSAVSAKKYGVLADHDLNADIDPANPSGPVSHALSGKSTINLTNTQIESEEDAIHVNPGAIADISIASGSTLHSQNNVIFSSGTKSVTSLLIDNSQINGDINNQGQSDVTLANNAIWSGASHGINNIDVKESSRWNVATGSTIAGNLNNAGTVSLGNTTQTGNVLKVSGDYIGQEGNLLINTVLQDDNSATDKLIIQGNASGKTNVTVNKVGGTGAQTLDGIKIIQVGGKSSADAFKQTGRIVAGLYDYKLEKKNEDWVLNSRVTTIKTNPPIPDPDPNPPIPDPNPEPIPDPVPNPTPTPIPTPTPPGVRVVRPEAGSYIANIATANNMFLTRLHERLGETRYINPVTGKWEMTTLWLRQVGNHNTFHDSSAQLKTTSNTYVAQLGGDIAQWSSSDSDRLHLGVMAGYGNSKSSTQSAISGYQSRGSLSGYSVGAYATWFANNVERTGAYIDSQLQYAWFNNHVDGEQMSSESYKSKGITASLEGGYVLAMGQSGPANNPKRYFFEPNVQATWMGIKADSLHEENGTTVSSQGDGNVQTRAGLRAFMQGNSSKAFAKGQSFQPYVELNWLHNSKRFGTSMNGVSLQQAGTVNIGEAKVGVEGQVSKSTQLWGNVGQQMGDKGYSNSQAMLGVKYWF